MAIDFDGVVGDDLNQIVSDMGHVVTFDGNDIDCVVSGVSDALTLDPMGVFDSKTLTLLANQSAFTTVGDLPVEEDTLTYDGQTYRVKTVTLDPNGVSITLTCEEETA